MERKSMFLDYIFELEDIAKKYDQLKRYTDEENAKDGWYFFSTLCPDRSCKGNLYRPIESSGDYRCNVCHKEYKAILVEMK